MKFIKLHRWIDNEDLWVNMDTVNSIWAFGSNNERRTYLSHGSTVVGETNFAVLETPREILEMLK